MNTSLTDLSSSIAEANNLVALARPLLEMLHVATGLESTYLTSIDEAAGEQHVKFSLNHGEMKIPEGLTVPWNDTLCKRALDERTPICNDVESRWGDSSAAKALGIKTYASAPVRTADGVLVGTLCAAGANSVELGDIIQSTLNVFSKMISQHLEREMLLQQLKDANLEALRINRRLKAITDNVPVLIGSLDKDLVYRFVNRTYEEWFGMKAEQVLGRTPADLLSPAQLALARPNFDKALAGEPVYYSSIKEANANVAYPKHVNVSYLPERDENGLVTGFIVLAFDETERRNHEQGLAHLANHDSLTQLPNRRLFEDRLQHALQREARHKALAALFYLDIDHFKQINDQHGHEYGDILLRQFAGRLQASVRVSDTVARLGGDEFVVLMEDLQVENDAEVVASKILQAVRAPFDLGALNVSVTTSIGISFSDRSGISANEFVGKSDQALYQAKRLGRDRYFVHK